MFTYIKQSTYYFGNTVVIIVTFGRNFLNIILKESCNFGCKILEVSASKRWNGNFYSRIWTHRFRLENFSVI